MINADNADNADTTTTTTPTTTATTTPTRATREEFWGCPIGQLGITDLRELAGITPSSYEEVAAWSGWMFSPRNLPKIIDENNMRTDRIHEAKLELSRRTD